MKIIAAFLVFILPSAVFGCPDFYGKWKSSKELTMEFTNKWVNIEQKSKDFLSQITGTATVEFKEYIMVLSDTPLRKIVLEGKEMDWVGVNETVSYELLGCTSDRVAIRYRIFGRDFISVLNFQSENIYWEYMGSPDTTENAHTREYFVRVEALDKPMRPTANGSTD